MKRFITSENGLTLMELLVAIAMTTIVVAAVFTTFIVQQRSFGTQDQVAEMVQSSKIAFNMLTDTIRNAGLGYPEFEQPNINGNSLVFEAVDSGANGGPDSITLIGGFRMVATLAQALGFGSNQMRIDYIDEPEFNLTDKSHISIDGIGYARIIGCTSFTAEGKCQASGIITLDRTVNVSYPVGRPVYIIEDITFCVNGNRELQMRKRGADSGSCTGGGDVDTILQNVDDLQFGYGVDTNNDNVIEWYDTPPAGNTVSAIRVGLVTRTMREDQDLSPASKPYSANGITLENNTTPDNDRFRRMVWQMIVKIRNPRRV